MECNKHQRRSHDLAWMTKNLNFFRQNDLAFEISQNSENQNLPKILKILKLPKPEYREAIP